MLGTIAALTTDVDIVISRFFYDFEAKRWLWQKKWYIALVYRHGPHVTAAFFLFAFIRLLLSYLHPKFMLERAKAYFVIFCLLIGPLFLVHGVMKDGFNRPRPIDIIEFRGKQPFQKVLTITKSDFSGKSFPSGHAAAGFILVLFYFLYKDKTPRKAIRALSLSLAFGIALSFTRIAMGGHFFSDTLWAFAISWYLPYLLYHTWYLPYWQKLENRPLFSPSRIRSIAVGTIATTLLLAALFYNFMLVPFHIDCEPYTIQLPAQNKPIHIRVRAQKGNLHVYIGKSGEIRIETWVKGRGFPDFKVDRTFKAKENETAVNIDYSTAPGSVYASYQSHTSVFIPPQTLQIEWDLKTKLGKIFRHD